MVLRYCQGTCCCAQLPDHPHSHQAISDLFGHEAQCHDWRIRQGLYFVFCFFPISLASSLTNTNQQLEVDVARRTHKLFSKILIGAAIPHTLVYWAPELLKLESYGLPVDIWALGVSLYQIITGELPFDTSNEENFRDDVITATVDWSRLEGYHSIGTIIENCLRPDPDERWTANQVLAYAQQEFSVEIQRTWRGC